MRGASLLVWQRAGTKRPATSHAGTARKDPRAGASDSDSTASTPCRGLGLVELAGYAAGVDGSSICQLLRCVGKALAVT